ncbi:hypothetical protein LP421_15970 [Rhizobium sp. RCAM05350]|nr:hypothetical protein LP421_15970 [Rhizobium sp. RCAM05350]
MAIDWIREKHSRFIKICGITTVEDAAVCADLDVDAIGILLERPGKSPKAGSARLPVELAAAISSSIRGKCQVFTLIHTERPDLLDNYARIIQPDVMQMCLDISSPTLMQFREKWPEIGIMHSLRVAPETTTTELKSRIDQLISDKILDGVILDSAKGGSGQAHDWTVSAQIVEAFPELPMLLAGD